MNEWKLFLDRGKKDLEDSQKMFENYHDYEISAYLAQQALEKYLKAYLLKSKVVTNPEDLGHYQILHILTIIGTHFNTIRRNTDKSSPFYLVLDHVTNIFDHLRNLFDSIKNDNEKLIHWWKNSIKIEQNVKDEDYDRFVDLMKRSGGRLEKSFGIYKQNLEKTLGQFPQIPEHVSDEIKDIAEKMEKATTQLKHKQVISQEDTKKFANEELKILLKAIQLQKQRKIKGNMPMADLEKALIISDVLANYINLIMRTHPHTIIGRYPIFIEDSISSTQLYEKYKEGVWSLIQEVKESCNELEIKIKHLEEHIIR